MSAGDRSEFVRSITFFEGLPDEALEELGGIALEREVERGTLIFGEGEPGLGFYAVLAGRVKIFKLSLDGKEQILHIFGPGEPFGEVAVFAGKGFPAHAAALEKSRLLFFPREALRELIRKSPDLTLNMLAVLSLRLRAFTRLVENLSLKEVPARLASYLAYLARTGPGGREVELDISKGQLASLLGTIPETLSRILARLSEEGLIESDGRRIRILDEERLRDLAEGGGL